jgi:urease accessory protein
MRVRLILATALSSVPAVAFAHPGGPGALGFTEGFLHPLTGLDHLTAAVIVGLLAALARPAGAVLGAFLGALAAGLFMGTALPLIASAAEIGILLTFAALAGAFILRKTRAWVVPLAAAVTGLAHGLAHGADGAGAAAFAAGVLAATAALVLAGCLAGHWSRRLRRTSGSARA